MTAEKIALTVAETKLAIRLLEVGAIKFGAFRLKLHEKNPEAPLSPIYVDLRTPDNPKPGPLTPAIVQQIGILLEEIVSALRLPFLRIAGVPNAGDPLAEALSQASSDGVLYPLLQLEKQDTISGRRIQGRVNGAYSTGERILLVDDLITAAHSKLEAIQLLEDQGLTVRDVLVVLDREQGGKEALKKRGYNLYSIFRLSTLLTWYLQEALISGEKFEKAMAYLATNS